MDGLVDVLVAGESFITSVKGDNVIECRARAWDELQKILGLSASAELAFSEEAGEVEPEKGLDVEDQWSTAEGATNARLRDPVSVWIAVQMAHGPNPERIKTNEDGTTWEDESEPRLVCSVVFARSTPGRPTFA